VKQQGCYEEMIRVSLAVEHTQALHTRLPRFLITRCSREEQLRSKPDSAQLAEYGQLWTAQQPC
jgi:hypothetical protein